MTEYARLSEYKGVRVFGDLRSKEQPISQNHSGVRLAIPESNFSFYQAARARRLKKDPSCD